MRALLTSLLALVLFACGDPEAPLSLRADALKDAAWDVNDVSILLPLPQVLEQSGQLRTTSAGVHGPLLPQAYLEQVGSVGHLSPQKAAQALRVVGIRLDPCFPGPQCRPQVRLVWQPLHSLSNDTLISTLDAAVHTFYDVPETEFAALLEELRELRNDSGVSTRGLPLGVHPVVAAQGLEGPFFQGVTAALLRVAGEQRLTRLTFMKVSGGGVVWDFGGFEVASGVLTPLTIPRVNATLQSFKNNPVVATYFHKGGATPAPQGPDTFNLLMTSSQDIQPQQQEKEIIEAAMSIYRIENPVNHSPESVDCVSCHVADAAKHAAIRQFPWLLLDKKASDIRYKSTLNLKRSTEQPSTANVRAFGYFFSSPSVSQRTINESAHVAARLNQTEQH